MTPALHEQLLQLLGPRPIYERVEGAPRQPGERVVVVAVTDSTVDPEHVGKAGTVRYLEYSCGCGQRYPDWPMIGVELDDGAREELWPEELGSPKDFGRQA